MSMIDTAVTTMARGAYEQALDAVRDTDLPELATRLTHRSEKPRRRRGMRRLLIVLAGVVGAGALVWFVMQRRRTTTTGEFAPDAFGEAVEEERAAGAFGQRPFATPGA